MDDISILEELGLEEVSRKTHIETKYLEYMVNKKFEKLSRINTLGFVKILRREYHLDLQKWVDEFEAFLGANEQEAILNSTLLKQDIDSDKPRAWIYILILLLILLGFGFWYFDGMKYVNQLKEHFYEKNASTFTQAPIIQEAKEKLEILEKKIEPTIETIEIISTKKNVEENNISNNESVEILPQDSSEENVSATPVLELDNEVAMSNETVQDNTTIPEVEKVEILNMQTVDQELPQENELKTQEVQNVQEPLPKEIILKPYKKIWVGIINLKTKKRATQLTTEDISLDTKDPLLLVVGHGNFIFELDNGKTQKSSDKQKSYYHIADGKIDYINKENFIKLNGGKNW